MHNPFDEDVSLSLQGIYTFSEPQLLMYCSMPCVYTIGLEQCAHRKQQILQVLYDWLVAILTIYSRAVSLAIERNRLTLPVILVRTLFCPKGTDMAMHAANTTEAVPSLKPLKSRCLISHSSDGLLLHEVLGL